MKKIAVFGKPGSGKSVVSKRLAFAMDIPLYPLDLIVYKKNGEHVEREVYDKAHEEILCSDCWIIDGLGPLGSFYQRLDKADTLVYIDLPYHVSYWLVTKRLLKSLFVKPEGWPKGSSVVKGTWQSYKTLKRCPQFWNEDFMRKIDQYAVNKSLYVIRSMAELNGLVKNMLSE